MNAIAIGSVFKTLTVVAYEPREGGQSWVCECQCGRRTYKQASRLLRGEWLTCRNCVAGIQAGDRFGHLTVIERLPCDRRGTIWRCRCSCGTEVAIIPQLTVGGR